MELESISQPHAENAQTGEIVLCFIFVFIYSKSQAVYFAGPEEQVQKNSRSFAGSRMNKESKDE